MRHHEFKIGQVVQVLPHLVPRKTKSTNDGLDRNRFEIVRLMPESGSVFQYRIRNTINGQERLVTETEIRSSVA